MKDICLDLSETVRRATSRMLLRRVNDMSLSQLKREGSCVIGLGIHVTGKRNPSLIKHLGQEH